MTELEAVNKSIDLWEWLVYNYPASKSYYPKFDDLCKLPGECHLCELFREPGAVCPKCPLGRCDYGSDYDKWLDGDDDSRQAAKNILSKLKARKKQLEEKTVIKSERIDKEDVSEYPCLKISKHGNIVLFSSGKTGVCVHNSEWTTKVGQWENEWDELDFKPYTGIIKLSNENIK